MSFSVISSVRLTIVAPHALLKNIKIFVEKGTSKFNMVEILDSLNSLPGNTKIVSLTKPSNNRNIGFHQKMLSQVRNTLLGDNKIRSKSTSSWELEKLERNLWYKLKVPDDFITDFFNVSLFHLKDFRKVFFFHYFDICLHCKIRFLLI